MAVAQAPDEAAEGTAEQRGGALEVALVALENRQIIDGHGDVGMVVSEHALLDGEGAHVQRTGASRRVAALLDGGQAGEVQADFEAPRAEHTPEYGERAPVEPGRLAQPAPRLHDRGQRCHVGGDCRVVASHQRRAQVDRPARVWLGARVVAPRVLDPAQVVSERRERMAVVARHEGQRPAIERERLRVPPLGLAQDAEVVEHAGDVAVAAAEAAADLDERGPVAAIGGRVPAERPIDAGQRRARADRQARDVGIS
jgi:hypothetical protein